MCGEYKVVTLCGSTRFKEEFMNVQRDLTLKGNIVISVGFFGHSQDVKIWEEMDEETFEKWLSYHFETCERQDLIGATNHALDILRKV